jgi:general secretion pathway protein F
MEFEVIYQENSKIKKSIFTKEQIDSNKLPDNVIKIEKRVKLLNKELTSRKKISDKKLKELFYELSVMLDSNILLDEALKILHNSQKDKILKEFINTIRTNLYSSTDISLLVKEYKLNSMVISFFSILKNSGNTVSFIKIISSILNENYLIKKEFKKALFYPAILVITFISALIGIFKIVVPKFEIMFIQYKMELSFATKMLFGAKNIYENYLGLILLFVFFSFIFLISLYKKYEKIKFFLNYIVSKKLYFFSGLYTDKIFYEYFLCMESLLNNGYKFHDSFTNSKVLIKNYYLLDRITQIENLLKSGKSIEYSLEQSKLFDELTLSLIKTGEVSNSLQITVGEIKNIYKRKFNDKLKFLSMAIEPIFFIIIMLLIIWIILAIFVPLWSIGDVLKI